MHQFPDVYRNPNEAFMKLQRPEYPNHQHQGQPLWSIGRACRKQFPVQSNVGKISSVIVPPERRRAPSQGLVLYVTHIVPGEMVDIGF